MTHIISQSSSTKEFLSKGSLSNSSKKFIINLPNFATRLKPNSVKRLQSQSKTLLVDSTTRRTNQSLQKSLNNIILNSKSTTRKLQHPSQVEFHTNRKVFSPRNFSSTKLRNLLNPNSKQLIQFIKTRDTSVIEPSIDRRKYCHVRVFTKGHNTRKQSQPHTGQQFVEMNINVTTTTVFIQKLKAKLQDKSCVGFETSPSNLVLDLFLTLDNCDISYLNGSELNLIIIPHQPSAKVDISSFTIHKCIGHGGFSKVFLCRFKQDGKFYAMKMIDKKVITKSNKGKLIMNQRNVMQIVSHPFVMEMKFAFETADKLVFVLEYCPGGELFSIIKKYHRMQENMARFYMVEILLGLEYLHGKGIIYRDFKPENILVGADGHVKIADFGLAKQNYFSTKDRAFSYCGSPEYMPPQMITKEGHSLGVDFYCLGAVLYEMVTGLPPFYSQDVEEIHDSTLNERLSFPVKCKLSTELKSLLKGLLCKDEHNRLGAQSGVEEILAHPWFGQFSRQQYLCKKVKPPVTFDSINSINLQPQQLRQKSSLYMLEAKRQQQQEKRIFEPILEGFYYDWRFETYIGGIRKTEQNFFKSAKQPKLDGECSKITAGMMKKVTSNKFMHRRMNKDVGN